MKIKFLLATVIAVCSTIAVYSQTSDEEAEAVINLLGVQKKQAVAQMVHAHGKDSTAFWKIYDQYLKENKETAKHRLNLYERTAEAYFSMSPALADSLANKYFVNRIDQEKTLQAYYNKIKAATNSVVAFQFYQAEVYILTMLRAQIMAQVPTYGELQRAARH